MAARLLCLIIGICFLVPARGFSQQIPSTSADTVKQEVAPNGVVKDSVQLAIEARPRIAATRSAILPGLGQIYNKRWWKVPLVYGGFVGIGLVFEFNHTRYKLFLKEAQFRQEHPGETQNSLYAGYSDQGIITIKDAYRRNRDLSILGGLGFYAIQIIDAYVDAKFFRFDVSDDLSIRVAPSVQNQGIYHSSSQAPAVGLKLNLLLN